ncbi:type II/IV secretion system ATPase subunit [Salinirubellus salinus]|uniref:Type II/IV secretion system ATPase subunit n=1 Tax=Salinirubellus salinus TaxID=1364945 RepID=A0A9E7UB28_9EURY|nr:type II/IV secretion system ATPase subunit [Salinirubellus salinus]UWM54409.1 type II/IV secretion system ATPase subunit [Salinirubellus salinus]
MEGKVPTVPPPEPPAEGWYAPRVLDQRAVHAGVVTTIRDGPDGFVYETRTPGLTAAGERARALVDDYLASAELRRPRTREGVRERMDRGFEPKYGRAIDRLTDCSPSARRRVEYHALADHRCLGRVTPHALDETIEVADSDGGETTVHTTDFAPCRTAVDPPEAYLDRFAGERLARYEVSFEGFSVPVVVYRSNVLGGDPFAVRYAVLEPDLLPGDDRLLAECKERIWEASADDVLGTGDRATFVRERAEDLLSRRLTARNAGAWLESTRHRVRAALAEHGLALPPVDSRYARDRLDDLVYYVLRDFVGYGQLTVPIRDPNLEDVEANRVGERVKVIPRSDVHDGRVPTNLTFEDETTFVNLVTQLAAEDGVELNASTPSAKVNLDPPGVDETIRCAVALPVVSEGGPHISIRKQAPDAMTPVDLVQRDALPTELVTLLWMLYESRGVVLFSGPTGVGKTTLMNAHMPFVPFSDRPVSIDEGSREVRLPHETGVSLTTRDHEDAHKRVSMADLMTEANYLNPDVEVIAEVNTPASFRTFAESLNTGHGLVGTTHAEDVEKLVNRVVEQGLPAYLLREIDLVVFPRHVDGERYVGEAVELLSEREFERLEHHADGERAGRIEKDGTVVCWNRVCRRERGAGRADDGFRFAYDHPDLGASTESVRTLAFERLAGRTDRSPEAVRREFRRKHGYVEYLVRDGRTDFDDLFGFLADLRTEEAATVERVHRRGVAADGGASSTEEGGPDGD